MSYVTRGAYTVLITVMLPFLLLKMGVRILFDRQGVRKSGPRRRFFERFGWVPADVKRDGVVFHVVSVGETIAAMNLIAEFLKAHPDLPVVVTCTTPTASNLIQERLQPQVTHCYLPFDHPLFIAIFLRRLHPKAIYIMETELWPNLSNACHRRNIALVLLNARLSKKSYNGYRKFKAVVRPMLQTFDCVSCQTARDADYFLRLGLPSERCQTTGNLKFDLTINDGAMERAHALSQAIFGEHPVWIAASTHTGEDAVILQAHTILLAQHPDLVLVLAPRHPQRAEAIAELIDKANLHAIRRTENRPMADSAQIFMLDTIGELLDFYAMSRVCFVGGSLVKHGGHNPLEPAALEKPILSGPYVHNFTKVYEDLCEEGGAVIVKNADALALQVAQWLDHQEKADEVGKNARRYLEKHRGATLRSLNLLAKYA